MIGRARRALVLMYHRVAPGSDRRGLSVHPDRFASHLSALGRAADLVALEDVLRPSRDRRVAITFDDGYSDNAGAALEALETTAAPATIFLTAALVGRGGVFWQDRLARILRDAPPGVLELTVEGRWLWLDARSPTARLRAESVLHSRLRRLPPAQIEAVVAQVEAQLGPAPTQGLPRTLDRAELATLEASPLIGFGAHTVHHPMLSRLSPPEQLAEVVEGRRRLEELLGRRVSCFAYPFGTAETFSDDTVEAVRRAGFRLAVTAVPGAVKPRVDPLRVPRLYVGDWDSGELMRKITQWIGGR